MAASFFLKDVPSTMLAELLRRVQHKELPLPLEAKNLARFDLRDAWPAIAPFASLDSAALDAMVTAVLIARGSVASGGELVWTGPSSANSPMRDTWVVIEELFGKATREVFIAGYAFDHGEALFATLRRRMDAVNIRCDIVMHADPPAQAQAPQAFFDELVRAFQRKLWRGPGRLPNLYIDPHTCVQGSRVSMHAKCIVVDSTHALVGSANFTDRGFKRNIEMGVLLTDHFLARQIIAQWQQLIAAGKIVPLTEG